MVELSVVRRRVGKQNSRYLVQVTIQHCLVFGTIVEPGKHIEFV